MNVSLLALRRARKQLDAFCAQRCRPGNELVCRTEGDSLVLQHNGQSQVRVQLNGAQWSLFWMREDGQWETWPLLPVCEEIQQVIEALQQAPLHIHWGA